VWRRDPHRAATAALSLTIDGATDPRQTWRVGRVPVDAPDPAHGRVELFIKSALPTATLPQPRVIPLPNHLFLSPRRSTIIAFSNLAILIYNLYLS
jgi:hypothetical protein